MSSFWCNFLFAVIKDLHPLPFAGDKKVKKSAKQYFLKSIEAVT